MTEPVFDANGWCSDMKLAPMNGDEILLYDDHLQWLGYWHEDEEWTDGERVFCPTHWKPLGPGPVGT